MGLLVTLSNLINWYFCRCHISLIVSHVQCFHCTPNLFKVVPQSRIEQIEQTQWQGKEEQARILIATACAHTHLLLIRGVVASFLETCFWQAQRSKTAGPYELSDEGGTGNVRNWKKKGWWCMSSAGGQDLGRLLITQLHQTERCVQINFWLVLHTRTCTSCVYEGTHTHTDKNGKVQEF